MKKILFLLILTTFTYATNLLTHNIYDREDRVDIMLSFDSPYTGQIYQDKTAHTMSLKLSDLSFSKSIKKAIKSKIIQELSIVPNKNYLLITLTSKQGIDVIASKTTDGFGLRIRAKLAKVVASTKSTIDSLPQNDNLQNIAPFKDSSLIDTRYIIVVTFLFVLLILMIWLKKRVSKGTLPASKPKSWLFKNIVPKNADIRIIHKKPIDPKNSLLVFEYENKRYLVMSGNSNVLIDTFGSQDLEKSSDFERAFEDNRKKLDDYLKLQDRKLEDYKDKASNEYLHEQN